MNKSPLRSPRSGAVWFFGEGESVLGSRQNRKGAAAIGSLMEAMTLQATLEGLPIALDPAWEGWGLAGRYMALDRPQSCVSERSTGPQACVASGPVFGQGRTRVGPDRCPPRPSLVMPPVPSPETLKPLDAHMAELGQPLVRFWSKLDCRPMEFRALSGPRVQSKRLQRWYRFRNEPSPATHLQRAMAAPILIDANIWAAHWRMVESEPDYTCPPSISRSGCTIWAQRPRGSCWMRRRPPLATTSSMVRRLSGPQTARLSRPTEANA